MRVHRGWLLRQVVGALLTAAFLLVGCGPMPGPLPAPTSESPLPTPEPAALPAPDQDILALPLAFRYEVSAHPAGMPDEPAAVTTGQYRAGAWSQKTAHGEDAVEESIVAADPATDVLHSYTRAGDAAPWTRWPGAGFDAGYGFASPFAVLRLYPLADEMARGDSDTTIDAPETVTKVQAIFTPETIGRLLAASAAAVTTDAETRAALESQVSALLAPQTITYWVSEGGRIYQAAATLLTVGENSAPTPWLEVVWRFSDYDDASIIVEAPSEFNDVADLAGAPVVEETGAREPELDPAATLRVRVFENQGVLAQNATVTVYPAGKSQAVDERASADAQFALPAGTYDVLVRAANAEQRLDGVVVMIEGLASRDVLFDFGILELTVQDGSDLPQVDIVIYPSGQREEWAGYRSENPATVRVPAGVYDIEVGLPDFSGTKTVSAVEVKGGQTTTLVIDINQ